MRALLHLGLFVLALTVVGQASADHDDDDRRRERRTTVVIAPKVEHRTVRPVRAPVEPMPPWEPPGSLYWYPWPYYEALRLDEAVNPLALVVTGLYGEPLPSHLKENGGEIEIIPRKGEFWGAAE